MDVTPKSPGQTCVETKGHTVPGAELISIIPSEQDRGEEGGRANPT